MIGLSKEYRSFISDFAIKSPPSCRTLTNFLVYPLPGIEIVQRKSMVGECYLRVLLSYIGRMQLFEESVQTMFLAECFPVIISAKQYFNSDCVLFTNAISSVVRIILEHNPSAIKLLYCSLIDNDSIPFLMVALELSWKFKLSTLKLQDILEETTYGEDEQNIRVAELLSESFRGDSSQSMMTSFQICDYYIVNFLDCILVSISFSMCFLAFNDFTSLAARLLFVCFWKQNCFYCSDLPLVIDSSVQSLKENAKDVQYIFNDIKQEYRDLLDR